MTCNLGSLHQFLEKKNNFFPNLLNDFVRNSFLNISASSSTVVVAASSGSSNQVESAELQGVSFIVRLVKSVQAIRNE